MNGRYLLLLLLAVILIQLAVARYSRSGGRYSRGSRYSGSRYGTRSYRSGYRSYRSGYRSYRRGSTYRSSRRSSSRIPVITTVKCGVYASYNAVYKRCICLSGYTGNAYSGCTPLALHNAVDSVLTAAAPAEGIIPTCGANAFYSSTSRACVCKSGYYGSPTSGCTVRCGANASYSSVTKRCCCNTGYTGNPTTGCTAAKY